MRICPSRRAFLRIGCGSLLAPAAGIGAAPVEYQRGGMVYRRLGATGIDVSLLSFGSHTDPADRVTVRPDKTMLTPAGPGQARPHHLRRPSTCGVNLLDVYESEGQWEPAARIVQGRRDKVIVSLAHEVTPPDIDTACRRFGHVDLYRFHTADIDDRALENWDLSAEGPGGGQDPRHRHRHPHRAHHARRADSTRRHRLSLLPV